MPAALVTGGVLRVGKAIALSLAEKGFDIALHFNSSSDAVSGCVDSITEKGVICRSFSCDFNSVLEIPGFLKRVKTSFDGLELLVNSASLFLPGNIENTTTTDLTRSMNVNLMAPFVLMREFRKIVSKGHIINITDQRISRYAPSYSAYAVSKAALSHLTVMGAVEFGPEIRVNAIAPGLILPNVNKDDGDYFKKRGSWIPLKRNGNVRAVTLGVEYLLENDFITGETLHIDGGESKLNGTL